MTFKRKVYDQYLRRAKDNISLLNAAIGDVRESSMNETKSSAGDKFETDRAMLHAEQERLGRQLKDALEQKRVLETIDINTGTTHITVGSLVKTNKGFLFVSAALGEVKVDDLQVVALSPQSPLGQKLMGLAQNGTAEINGTTYVVEKID